MNAEITDKDIEHAIRTCHWRVAVNGQRNLHLCGEAILLYEQSTRRLMPWQQEQLYNIMAIDEDGYWKHIKYGWSIPRRNGKSEVAIARVIWGLLHDEAVLYTAHLVNTSTSAFIKIVKILGEMGYIENEDIKINRQKGGESIKMLKGGKGYINFRTRTGTGGKNLYLPFKDERPNPSEPIYFNDGDADNA